MRPFGAGGGMGQRTGSRVCPASREKKLVSEMSFAKQFVEGKRESVTTDYRCSGNGTR